MKLTYFGHSAFQIEGDNITILVDPFISENPLNTGFVRLEDLRPDVILLTHAHGDHWGDTPEIAAQSGALVISNHEIVSYLSANHGYENVHGMNTGGSSSFDWGKVTYTWARHSSSFPDSTNGGNPGGFIIEIDGKTIYAAGDTDRFAEMAWYGEEHTIDLALLPIGDCFTMGHTEAARAVQMLRPGLSVPIHWGTFPPLTGSPDTFVELVTQNGGRAQKILPGGSLTF